MEDQNMVCQKLNYNMNNNLVKNWVHAFFKLYIKKGYKMKAFSWLKLFILKLNKVITTYNIETFFRMIENQFPLQITFRKRVVAGKVVKIPVFLSQEKKIWFNVRFIFQSLKEKSELTFLDKLINELLQIVKKKGNTLKKYSDFQKDIKLLLPNNRFIDK